MLRVESPGLRVESLSVRFDGVQALDAVAVSLGAGEALGLIGPNGSGKTTLLDAICGLIAPDSGGILLDGQDIAGAAPHSIARRGVARTFQGVRLFERMTALENVQCAQPGRTSLRETPVRRGDDRTDAEQLLKFVEIAQFRDVLAEDLPLSARRRLELARALARRPRLLLLDEPAGALADAEAAQMAQLLRSVNASGCALILVEHHIELLTAVCSRVVALDCGRVVTEGTPEAVLADARVRSAYLGVTG